MVFLNLFFALLHYFGFGSKGFSLENGKSENEATKQY